MGNSAVISVPVAPETEDRLSRLADSTKRSKAALVAEAIEQYLAVQEWQIAEIEAGIAELDRGEGIPHEEVEAWAASLRSQRDTTKRRA